MTCFRFAVKYSRAAEWRVAAPGLLPHEGFLSVLEPPDVGVLTEPVSQSGLDKGCGAPGKTLEGECECLRSTAWLEHTEAGKSIWNEGREG